jgi:hypothetical protein
MAKVLSGSEFNKQYPSTLFVKLTNETEIHNGFQFKTGLNIDVNKFNPIGECKFGGIYFCEIDKARLWFRYGYTICVNCRDVQIPDDAQVYIEYDKFKADKLILSSKTEIWSHNKLCQTIVAQEEESLQKVKLQTEEICLIAVKRNPNEFLYIIDQTYNICKTVVNRNGLILKSIRNKTDEICKLALMQNGFALQYVEKQTYELCRIAVEQNGLALRYVETQTEELCKIAVRQSGSALEFVINQTEEICIIAVVQNFYADRYVNLS